jgi:hypothetical protein
MKEAIIAGILSGFISSLVLAWLSRQIFWKSQKRNEIRMNAFIDTLTALSLFETDSMDMGLQSDKKEYKGQLRVFEYRPEASIAMGRATGMVKAFFSMETFNKADKAFKTKISIENVPNIEFYENRTKAVVAMSNESGLNNASLFKAIAFSADREDRASAERGGIETRPEGLLLRSYAWRRQQGGSQKTLAILQHLINFATIVTCGNISLFYATCNSRKGTRNIVVWLESNCCKTHGITKKTVAEVVGKKLKSK